MHLLRRHRSQLRVLSAAHIGPARRLLVSEVEGLDDDENQPPTPPSSKASRILTLTHLDPDADPNLEPDPNAPTP